MSMKLFHLLIGGEWKHSKSQPSIFLVVLILIVSQDSPMEWTKSQIETCHYFYYGDFLTQRCADFYESKRYNYKQQYLTFYNDLNEGEEKMVMRIWKTRIALGGPLMIQKVSKKTWNQREEKYHLIKNT